jgi:hypothetical protein
MTVAEAWGITAVSGFSSEAVIRSRDLLGSLGEDPPPALVFMGEDGACRGQVGVVDWRDEEIGHLRLNRPEPPGPGQLKPVAIKLAVGEDEGQQSPLPLLSASISPGAAILRFN